MATQLLVTRALNRYAEKMHFPLADLPRADQYRLLVNTIMPRPIAWVATRDGDGRRNLAPFSFFNALCSMPPIIGVGIAPDVYRDGTVEKDSLAAIRQKGEFVVALVNEANAEAMNLSAANAPPGVDEFEFAGLEAGEAKLVDAPTVASAPVNFECRLWQLLEPAPHTGIVLGEVVAITIADELLGEEDGKMRIDAPAMKLIGRGHGSGWYIRSSDQMLMERKNWPVE